MQKEKAFLMFSWNVARDLPTMCVCVCFFLTFLLLVCVCFYYFIAIKV